MIRRMLGRITVSSKTFTELAQEFRLTEAEFKNRLELMVRMGYLEAITTAGAVDARDACRNCLFASRCKGDVCSEGPSTVGYRLTEKGKRVARKPLGLDKIEDPRSHVDTGRLPRGRKRKEGLN